MITDQNCERTVAAGGVTLALVAFAGFPLGDAPIVYIQLLIATTISVFVLATR